MRVGREREWERNDRGDLSYTGQHSLIHSIYVGVKKHWTHYHDLCLSSQHYGVYPSSPIRVNQSEINCLKCIFKEM